MSLIPRLSPSPVSRRTVMNACAALSAFAGVSQATDTTSPKPTSGTTATPVRPPATVAPAPAGGPARFFGDRGPGLVYYGASVVDTIGLTNFEKTIGTTLGLHRGYFRPQSQAGLFRHITDDHARGRLPSVSTKVPDTWAACASGKQDTWFKTMLGTMRATGKPIFLTLHHEPENDAGPTGMAPQDWREMNEHVHALTLTYAPNVTIVPILMQYTFTKYARRRPVDWVPTTTKVFSVDCYNAWSPTNGLQWLSLAEKMDLAMPYAAGRPVVLGEYGCRTDPTNPGRAADWLHDAFDYCRTHNIVSMSYFNSWQNSRFGTWELSGERLTAFKEIIASTPAISLT